VPQTGAIDVIRADELQYLHRDHQGGVVATTDDDGDLLDRFEYDAFGARTTTVGSDERMHRGYTGHEHLAALDLIHMNGRVQDPLLGRFLSPDPFVQAPYHSQSLNRYSYVWNNPDVPPLSVAEGFRVARHCNGLGGQLFCVLRGRQPAQ
jgi:RHS repeat-associated protein